MSDTNIRVISDREDIVAIADAVRNKNGQTERLTLDEIVDSINNISGTGVSENLDDVLAEQDSLLTELERVYAGKVDNKNIDGFKYVVDNQTNSDSTTDQYGGTCTVTYTETSTTRGIICYLYRDSKDGKLYPQRKSISSDASSITINTLKGSQIVILAPYSYYNGSIVSISGSATLYSSGQSSIKWVQLGDDDTVEITATWITSSPDYT